jgi:hypothetical protein
MRPKFFCQRPNFSVDLAEKIRQELATLARRMVDPEGWLGCSQEPRAIYIGFPNTIG